MERSFELGLITLDEYNQLAGRLDLPISRHRSKFYNYFRLLNEISYGSFDSLIESHIEDLKLNLHSVWFPHSDLSLREMPRKIIRNRDYLDYVKYNPDDQDRCVVKVGNKRRDLFTYFHERDLWVLRRILIHDKNFRKYQFSIAGVEYAPPLSFYGIVAISEKPVQNLPSLEARI